MGWIHILISGIATFLFWKVQNNFLMIVSILVLIGTLWSYGVMHNFAVKAAKKRNSHTGEFYDFTKEEVETVPNWITAINMVMSFIGIILLVASIIFLIKK